MVMLNGVNSTNGDDCVPVLIPIPPSAQLGLAGIVAVVGITLVRRRHLSHA
jgi:hypothetical protein